MLDPLYLKSGNMNIGLLKAEVQDDNAVKYKLRIYIKRTLRAEYKVKAVSLNNVLHLCQFL